MFAVDVTALRGKMGERKCNVTKLAKAVGVDRNTMAHYLDHPEKFPYPVMQRASIALGLSFAEAQNIFFREKLA